MKRTRDAWSLFPSSPPYHLTRSVHLSLRFGRLIINLIFCDVLWSFRCIKLFFFREITLLSICNTLDFKQSICEKFFLHYCQCVVCYIACHALKRYICVHLFIASRKYKHQFLIILTCTLLSMHVLVFRLLQNTSKYSGLFFRNVRLM